ncbi:phage tail assembly chaperone [Pseudomonas sp. Root562]|uniref:phage tail assembly chaperone n=1 Tax=Pseudomonas sp. Root562 TaxID=1736561 RepID=UPI00070370F5|nr:phage tail assembly chaperone [Pseudomonas sp. Root562]KQZ94556.1 phage tail protein [Pseudomonas sp. Root562]
MRFYSKETGCTYLRSVHGDQMPADVVPISEEIFLSVIANPARGKVRGHNAEGQPVLVDALPTESEALADLERQWRDGELVAVMWLRDRHRDQLEIGAPPTLSVDQFMELLVYMQVLRDWPQSPDFPDSQHRPIAPTWIADQAQ